MHYIVHSIIRRMFNIRVRLLLYNTHYKYALAPLKKIRTYFALGFLGLLGVVALNLWVGRVWHKHLSTWSFPHYCADLGNAECPWCGAGSQQFESHLKMLRV
jgi:hypothetical protein